MTLPAKTLTLLVFVSLGVNALLLLIMVATAGRKGGGGSRSVAVDDVLRGALDGQAKTFQRLEAAIRQVAADQQRVAHLLRGAVQRVGLVRYDAFEDVGGRLSFSCALLNDEGDGVVITSINGRQDTRVYAKPVHHAESMHNLSEEEAAAIREAMVGPRQTVEAR
ncbi:MAG: DUF4446 family protein [Actinomycetota bacterium]